jgi:hypothetical protein
MRLLFTFPDAAWRAAIERSPSAWGLRNRATHALREPTRDKVCDIVGLYLNLPAKATVLIVD